MNKKVEYILLLLFAGLLLAIIWPFIASVFFAVFFAAVFHPLFLKLKKRLSPSLSAFITLIITIVLVLSPLVLFLVLLTSETITFVQTLDADYSLETLEKTLSFSLFGYDFNFQNLLASAQDFLKTASTTLLDIAKKSLDSLLNFSFLLFVFFILYYYFLKEGEDFLKQVKKHLPFKANQKKKLLEDFKSTTKTVFLGSLLGSIFSGIAAYIGFLIFQVQAPMIWAVLAGILSLFPTIGTFFIYLLISALLGTISSPLLGIGLFIYYILVEIVLVQNIIKPKFLDDKINVHPILVFFSIVGGTEVFGSAGIIYGPLIVVIFVSLFQFVVLEKN